MNVITAAELLIDKIKKDYKDDIALVVIMGSYIYGETHSRSDLDMYYVPKTKRGRDLGFTFIIDNIGFDYWPISWERLERIASHDERITSIITEGKILYYSSEEDIEKFNQIKQKALDTSDRKKFIQKASDKLDEVYKHYFKLINSKTFAECRIHAINIIFSLTYAISLLNGDTIKRGRKKLKQEILNMPLVPNNFSELYDTVFISNDINQIKASYEKLISNTEILILKEKIDEPISFKENLKGFYEELINFYNKIYHACEINDSVTALFASVEITHEIEQILKGTNVSIKELPDLVGAYNPNNLESFALMAKNHQTKFVQLLANNGVQIKEFNNFDELKDHLDTL